MLPVLLPVLLPALALAAAARCGPAPDGAGATEDRCDFESCARTERGVLAVHIVPHTHDDVGWLKTVDQYYYGSKNSIQKAGVQYILDSVVRELWEDPKRRFIYVETAFFWKWWVRQSDDIRHKVHVLVRQGRLQFVGGAWSMNDEATTHYQSTIDQFTWGLRKLNDTFGRCGVPRVGWQIDPFGHSRELASNLAAMGYKGLFLGRIDYQDKRARLRNRRMETLWRGDDDLGAASDIFTGVLYNTYSPPSGFCFDVLCDDEPIVDDPQSPLYNVEARIAAFIDVCRNMSRAYKTDNILLTMGEDFQYQHARMWYSNLDKLIQNEKTRQLVDPKRNIRVQKFLEIANAISDSYRTDNVLLTMGDDFHYQNADMWFKNLDKLIESVDPCPRVVRVGPVGPATLLLPQIIVQKISQFLSYIDEQKKHYRTDNAIVTMGGDFTYQDARMWYKNLDKLIEYTNMKAAKDGLNIKLFYSTPTCYLKAVKDANPSLPTKQDDFFPYASDPTAYWTGYFTSRPTVKYFERLGNNYLQMAKQLQVLAGLEEHNVIVLDEMRSAMGIMQHHDAVTGTEKQHVAADYERILDQAIDDSLTIPRRALSIITQRSTTEPPLLQFSRCMFNESSCATSEASDKFIVTVYNPVGWVVEATPIRVPVVDARYAVYGPDGSLVSSQLVELPREVLNIPTRSSVATDELVFIAKNLPALGFRSYYVQKQQTRSRRSLEDSEGKAEKNYFYGNLNDYWKNIKHTDYVNYKNVETQPDIGNSRLKDDRIPMRPINLEQQKYISDGDVDVMRGDLEDGVGVEQLAKLIKEERVSLKQKRREDSRSVRFPSLSDDEMRMLSDEPVILERYRDDYLENPNFKIRIDNETGKVTHVIWNDGVQPQLNISFMYYPGCVGNNEKPEFRSSGAYIFRPNDTEPTEIDRDKSTKIVKGEVTDEMQFRLDEYVSGVARVYKDAGINYAELEWLVGPIPIKDDVGKEIIVRYSSDLTNNGVFYSDSNGRQALKRRLNQRPQYNVTLEEPVAGNYYPITNKIYIEDPQKNVRLSVVTDRAQGGASLAEGQLEVMLHRRLLHDDAFGVGEALNETVKNGVGLVARGKHLLFMQKANDKSAYIDEKTKVIEAHLSPQVFISSTDIDKQRWLDFQNEYSGLAKSLPKGIHLLTLEPWRPGKFLLRLENYLEKSDGRDTVVVDLNGLLKNLKLKSLKETTLAANQWLEEDAKWAWNTESDFSKNFNEEYGSFSDVDRAGPTSIIRNVEGFRIEMPPRTIRTFVVDYEFAGNS